jgi:hypothetical protein
MKVFWAWQSDTPGKTGRHFMRSVLEAAIEKLNRDKDIDEPDEGFQSAYRLDHDRKGLRGSPDLAAEILKKIENSDVIVADVTPVAMGRPFKTDDGREHEGKRVMNPKVAIELGFALKALKSERLLMVLNTHFGNRDHVPFDLASKAGPILYKLAPNATPEQIKAEAKRLIQTFVDALELYDESPAAAEPTPKFDEAKPVSSLAFFAPETEVLGANVNSENREKYRIDHGPAFYMRLMPHANLNKPVHADALFRHVGEIGNFGYVQGGFARRNRLGSIFLDPTSNDRIDCLCQAFRTGEIWGVNVHMTRNGERLTPKIVAEDHLEGVMVSHLPLWVKFMRNVVETPPPYTVEAGIVNIERWHLQSMHASGGELFSKDIILRDTLKDDTQAEQYRFLLRFFEGMFNQAGLDRPPHLNGFPPQR